MSYLKLSDYIRLLCFIFILFFFFQAEDGIRDLIVTGVQTCALPISIKNLRVEQSSGNSSWDTSGLRAIQSSSPFPPLPSDWKPPDVSVLWDFPDRDNQIGRASCRERV